MRLRTRFRSHGKSWMLFEHFEGQLATLLPLQLPRFFLEQDDLHVDMDQIEWSPCFVTHYGLDHSDF